MAADTPLVGLGALARWILGAVLYLMAKLGAVRCARMPGRPGDRC